MKNQLLRSIVLSKGFKNVAIVIFTLNVLCLSYSFKMEECRQVKNFYIDSNIVKNWPKTLLKPFRKVGNKFSFSSINKYILDSTPIKRNLIDTFLLRKIHAYYKISKGSKWIFNQDLNTNYYNSIDIPINNLYPITVVQHLKETKVMKLILFNKMGQIKSIIEVSKRYSIQETPIEYTERLNDSTLEFISNKNKLIVVHYDDNVETIYK